jgi:hypothetical protein
MSKHRSSWPVLAAALVLTACGGGETPSTPTPEPTAAGVEATPEAAVGAPKSIDIQAARSRAKTAMFVPAPSEFQAAIKASNVQLDWKALITDGDKPLEGRSKPMLALEAGRRFANLLLTTNDGDKALIEGRAKAARDALGALGAPPELLAEIDKVSHDYSAGSLSQAELTFSLDILSRRVQAEVDKGAGLEVATLVQAGGWVQAVYVLASGLEKAGVAGDAAALMRQPTVLHFFMDFIRSSAPAQSKDPEVLAVLAEMEKLDAVAQKPELGVEDVKAVAAATRAIVAKF